MFLCFLFLLLMMERFASADTIKQLIIVWEKPEAEEDLNISLFILHYIWVSVWMLQVPCWYLLTSVTFAGLSLPSQTSHWGNDLIFALRVLYLFLLTSEGCVTQFPFPEHWGSLKLLPGSTQLLAFTIRFRRRMTSGAVGAPTRNTPTTGGKKSYKLYFGNGSQ